MKVLVVAHYFPPVGGAGVQRTAKFVKYMPELGWDPIVLAAENPSVPVFDNSLMDDLPPEVKIVRTKTLEPSYQVKEALVKGSPDKSKWKKWLSSKLRSFIKALLLPDPQILWWPCTIWQMFKIIKKEKVDVVFATAPPFSVLFFSTILGRLCGVPVVIDFRDEWVFARETLEQTAKGWWPRFFDQFMERLSVGLCTNFTAATQSYVTSISARHQKQSRGKGIVITNGFDEDDFSGLGAENSNDNPGEIVSIVYVGTVWKATTLKPFIDSINDFVKDNEKLAKKIRVKIFGRVVDSEKDYLISSQARFDIQLLGYQPHKDILKELVAADTLLLTLTDLPGAERIIPGKLFEYLASGSRILADVPSGETKNILEKCPKGRVLWLTRDRESTSRLFKKLIGCPKLSFAQAPEIEVYSRRFLTKRLVDVFDSVLGGKA
ncbi:hypothetical protein A7E78_00365 [Syntrophotalea acetylenivorans]|uniref:Glycosyltransferase subfamily 4-like N-terminal domain-containing protein n=1 Tax=Syntrophotalea acetylenivorans TaxID=1842532 RepID=A0A1L3GKH5_9BACT|nr:hypothetical protein [Syntrophotalea acetylenivorans]APG26453.1 hypothetical protein A7E78_00365 [Syntrophotalea acetylenivorans]